MLQNGVERRSVDKRIEGLVGGVWAWSDTSGCVGVLYAAVFGDTA